MSIGSLVKEPTVELADFITQFLEQILLPFNETYQLSRTVFDKLPILGATSSGSILSRNSIINIKCLDEFGDNKVFEAPSNTSYRAL
jgi:hypothetical protein